MQTEFSSASAGDARYLDSYDNINVHKIMLKDTSRLLAYKRFIEENAELFANKVIVDVGSGTGILSLLAAQAGAQHVRFDLLHNYITVINPQIQAHDWFLLRLLCLPSHVPTRLSNVTSRGHATILLTP